MKKNSSLIDSIKKFSSAIQNQIPAVEAEALQLIKEKCTDVRTIEYYLDTLHSLHISGFVVKAQKPLIKYLSKIDPELAEWHRKEFENS